MSKFTLTWFSKDHDQFAGEAALSGISEREIRRILGLSASDLLLGEFRLSNAQVNSVTEFANTKIDTKAYDYFITPT